MLWEYKRLKRSVSVARSLHLDLAKLRDNLSRKGAISDVIISIRQLVVKMARHLTLESELNKATDKLGERTAVHGLAQGLALLHGLLCNGSQESFEFW
jgi:hypothetical protein